MNVVRGLLLLLPGVALAAQPSPQHGANPALPKPHASSPAQTNQIAPLTQKPSGTAQASPAAAPAAPAAPAPATAAKSGLTLDAYVNALADEVPLSKDEKTDVKTYYQEDGAKLQTILGDSSISPFEQAAQVDTLRDARNAKIEALLMDAGREAEFRRVERLYRVALVELAAQGGLVPGAALPNVPQPTSTTPSQADQQVQERAKTSKLDTVPGT